MYRTALKRSVLQNLLEQNIALIGRIGFLVISDYRTAIAIGSGIELASLLVIEPFVVSAALCMVLCTATTSRSDQV